MVSLKKSVMVALVALSPAMAWAQNLVKNGDFEQVMLNGVQQTAHDNYVIDSGAGNGGQYTLPGWTNAGFFAFAYGSGISDSVRPLVDGTNRWNLWIAGPGNPAYTPSNNGLASESPAGGNFFGSDGGAYAGALSQSIEGLVVGQSYTLSFFWAAAQLQNGKNVGDMGVGWGVTLGSDVKESVQTTIGNRSFSGWIKASYTFTASATTELLSFLPTTSNGSPPMSLLDGVSIMAAVPEPAERLLLGAGLGLVALRLRSRRTKR